jgi:CRP-like cAMP-binding protein
MGRIPKEQIEHLRGIPLFAGYSDRELSSIDALVEEIDVPAGDVLVRQGRTDAREFFVIVSGEADVQIYGRSVATLGPGDVVGEMAMLDQGPRTATVAALTDMHLLLIGPATFSSFVGQRGMAVALLRTVTRRLRRAGGSHARRRPA